MRVAVAGAVFVAVIGGACTPSENEPSEDALPECVRHVVSARGGSFLPALTVSPAEVEPGESVTVRGAKFPPSAPLHIVAIYGEDDCDVYSTFGDTFIATARSDASGRLDAVVAWPTMFDPYAGREQSQKGRPLPAGRYFLFAGPCARSWGKGAYCPSLLQSGTAPGDPIRYQTKTS